MASDQNRPRDLDSPHHREMPSQDTGQGPQDTMRGRLWLKLHEHHTQQATGHHTPNRVVQSTQEETPHPLSEHTWSITQLPHPTDRNLTRNQNTSNPMHHTPRIILLHQAAQVPARRWQQKMVLDQRSGPELTSFLALFDRPRSLERECVISTTMEHTARQ